MNGNRELEKEENELIFKYYTVLVFFWENPYRSAGCIKLNENFHFSPILLIFHFPLVFLPKGT